MSEKWMMSEDTRNNCNNFEKPKPVGKAAKKVKQVIRVQQLTQGVCKTRTGYLRMADADVKK